MNENKFNGKTYEEWLELAKKNEAIYREGMELEAVENFRSQYAIKQLISKYREFADYAKTGKIFQIVLFDLDGNLIPGKWVSSKYGASYLTNDGKWLNSSNAVSIKTKIKNDAKKGFYEGSALFKVEYNENVKAAYADTTNPDNMLKIIDNGK